MIMTEMDEALVDQFSVQVFIAQSRKLQESIYRGENNGIDITSVIMDPKDTQQQATY